MALNQIHDRSQHRASGALDHELMEFDVGREIAFEVALPDKGPHGFVGPFQRVGEGPPTSLSAKALMTSPSSCARQAGRVAQVVVRIELDLEAAPRRMHDQSLQFEDAQGLAHRTAAAAILRRL